VELYKRNNKERRHCYDVQVVDWVRTIEDNRTGGIISVWYSLRFNINSSEIGKRFIILREKWKEWDEQVRLLTYTLLVI